MRVFISSEGFCQFYSQINALLFFSKEDWKVFLRVFAKRVFVTFTLSGIMFGELKFFVILISFLHFVRRDGVKKKRMGSLLCYYCFAGNIALFERLFAAISLELAGCRF